MPIWERAHLGFGVGTTKLGGEGSFKYKSYPTFESFLDIEITNKLNFKTQVLYTNLGGSAGLKYLPAGLGSRAGESTGMIVNDIVQSGDKKYLLPYEFKSKVFELSFIPQYDFIDITKGKKLTPYIFAGVGLYHFNRYFLFPKGYKDPITGESKKQEPGGIYLPEGQTSDLKGTAQTNTLISIPAGFGLKYSITRFIGVYGEFSRRILFTDYIDGYGSSGLFQNNNNDYFYPIMIGVYFRLGGFSTSLFNKHPGEHKYKEPKEKRRNISKKGCPPVYI